MILSNQTQSIQNKTIATDRPILVTGSSGLIGSALCTRLQLEGIRILRFDIRGNGNEAGDVRDIGLIRHAVKGCAGVIHLAAVSRVIWGEKDPDLCRDVNLNGIRNVIEAIGMETRRPWLVFASSREVYGNPVASPVNELHPLAPINIYGVTKQLSEVMVQQARTNHGIQTAVLRFSNVFGSVHDYPDRVIPAFIHAALRGDPLRVDGASNTFDFTWIDDVVEGIFMTVKQLIQQPSSLDPLHFVSGISTSLGELAGLVTHIAQSNSPIETAPPRTYDVSRFSGCPDRSVEVLGWRAKTPLHAGLSTLVAAMAANNLLPQTADAPLPSQIQTT
jgi:UDP-glucose 4-epimerase